MTLTCIRCSDINKFSKFITYITFTATNGTAITSNSLLLLLNTSSNDTKQRLLLVSSPLSISSVEQVVYLEVKNIVASRSAAVTHGYDIIHYSDDNDTKICSIQGPDNVKIVLVQVNADNNDDNNIDQELASKVLKYIETEVYKDTTSTSCSSLSSLLPPQTPSTTSSSSSLRPPSTPISLSITNNTDRSKSTIKDINTTEWNPPNGAPIPSIIPSLLHKSQYRPITANSPQPIPFENEIFTGQCILLLNTKKQDNIYNARFTGTKYLFECQVQGRFKCIPQGRLFMGAEITKKMELGLLSKGICAGILKLGRTVNAYLHHSFGDNNDYELPHITGPLWSAIDRLVITPDGKKPPNLGTVLPEDESSRVTRKKNPDYNVDVDLTHTYTFSFKTSNIDLINWKVSNIPMCSDIDLHVFWGDANIRLCGYCVPTTVKCEKTSAGLPKCHPQSSNQYMFALEVKHASNATGLEGQAAINMMRSPSNELYNINIYNKSNDDTENREYEEDSDDDTNDDDDDDDDFFDAGEGDITIDNSLDDVIYNDVSKFSDNNNNNNDRDDSDDALKLSTSLPSLPTSSSSSSKQPNVLSNFFSSNYVLAAIEVDDDRKIRKYGRRTLYAFIIDSNTTGVKYSMLRTYKEWTAVLPVKPLDNKPLNYARLSDIEIRRQELNRSYRYFKKVESSSSKLQLYRNKLDSFLSDYSHTSSFLIKASGGVSSSRSKNGLPKFEMESLCCTQLGNYFWSEECMGLTKQELIFIKSSSSLSSSSRVMRIPLRQIVSARAVAYEECSINILNTRMLLISTFSRQYMIMVRDDDGTVRDKWVEVLSSAYSNYISSLDFFGVDHSSRHLDVLVRPKGWSLGDRLVLNSRCFCSANPKAYFKQSSSSASSSSYISYMLSPIDLVAKLLMQVFQLCQLVNEDTSFSSGSAEEVPMSPEVQKLWIEFMDGVALLQSIDLNNSNLSGNDVLCLFLNLYHVLVLHAFLVVGVPTTLMKWSGFFNTCSYEAFGDVFTIAELEHNIIKSGFSRSNIGLISQIFIPQSRYSFAVGRRDYRLVFANNCGSMSMSPKVPIYDAVNLEKQLDFNVSYSLETHLIVDRTTVTVPAVCSWIVREFESPVHMLKVLLKHVRGEQEAQLFSLLSKKCPLQIKYAPFDFRCDYFKILSEREY